jgi:hypothetical protein
VSRRRPDDPVFQRLRLLSTLHLVFAGLGAILALFPLFHVAIGIGFVTGAFSAATPAATSPFIGWLFVALGAAAVVAVLVYSIALGIAANYLGQASHRDFCMVVAGVTCAIFPVGTALGVFTIVTLAREDVQRAFGRPATSPAQRSPSQGR